MMHIKYYLILLMSVFLAIGLGIVIGITLESKDIMENQHIAIAQQLEEEFTGLRNENRYLKENIGLLEESQSKAENLCQTLFTTTIANKLQGLKIALVEMGQESDYSGLLSLLKLSGASVESSITLQSEVFTQKQNIEQLLEVLRQQKNLTEELYSDLAENLLYSLIIGEYTPLINRMSELNLLRSLVELQRGCDVIILAGSSYKKDKNNNQMQFSKHFIKIAQELNVPIIAIENESTIETTFSEYIKMGISTVDHVDTIYGKLALVSLLYGNTGNYGVKQGNKGLIPLPLFPERHEDIQEEGEEEYILPASS